MTSEYSVWLSLLVPGGTERLCGRLVSRGFGVLPGMQGSRSEASSQKTLGALGAIIVKTDALKASTDNTVAGQIADIIKDECKSLEILYHNIFVVGNGDYGWCYSNIPRTLETDRRPICRKRDAMKRYDDMTTEEKRRIDDMLVVEVLNSINQSDDELRLPTDNMQKQYDQFEAEVGGSFCGCTSCMPNLRDALKKHPELTEYVLTRANSLKSNVIIPDQNDLVIKFDV